jgi:hypothetical protein
VSPTGSGVVVDRAGQRLAVDAEYSARVAAAAVALAMRDVHNLQRHLEALASGSDTALDALVCADSPDAVWTVWRDIEAMAAGKVEVIDRWCPAG